MDANDFKLKLVEEISNCDEILGIGQTGDMNAPLIAGKSDIFYMNGIDVMPMYFFVTDMEKYIDEILAGKHLEKEGSFYPIGRLASIETVNVLWEKNRAWTNIVNKVRTYPQDLFDKWYSSEVWKMIDDSIEELRKLCKELKEL